MEEVARVAYSSMADLHARLKNSAIPDVGVMAVYNRLGARDYANRWTSNPTSGLCDGVVVNCLQDTTKYNQGYSFFCCNDCANFVSQAVNFGGIPTDTTWTPYTNAWGTVPDLVTYMLNKKHWETATLSTCVAGYPMTSSSTHIVLMVYNDGVTRKYSGHTNDRLQVSWGNPTGATYYRVIY